MANVGRPFQIRGEIQTTDDLTIDGFVEGLVWSDGLAVTVEAGARVNGDIVARDIKVIGHVEGSLIASGVVELGATATVSGRVIAATFVLADGATFSGLVQPAQIDPAEQRDVAPATVTSHVSGGTAANRRAAVSAA